jgi:ribulose-phosphate 3-epimerase
MDGHFVPNLTIGPCVVKGVRPYTRLPLDVHLMIEEPIRYAEEFCRAGSDYLTIHVEATKQVRKTLRLIRKLGVKPGLSLRPRTPIKAVYPYLKEVDQVLIMTVEPGFGGQSFISGQLKKIERLRKDYKGLIAVDGGINEATACCCVKAGVDVVVAGTAVFGKPDWRKAIGILRKGAAR